MPFSPPNKDEILAVSGQSDAYIPLVKFGLSATITNGSTEDLWSYGGTLQYLSSAERMDVVSSSASDTLAIVVQGVDQDYNMINDLVVLNGTTPVKTNLAFLRIYRCLKAPMQPINVGNITLTAETSLTVQAYVEASVGSTEMSHFTIPAGYFGLLKSARLSISNRDDALVRVFVGSNGEEARSTSVFNANSPVDLYYAHQPLYVPEKSDVKIVVTAQSNNITATSNLNLLLVKEM